MNSTTSNYYDTIREKIAANDKFLRDLADEVLASLKGRRPPSETWETWTAEVRPEHGARENDSVSPPIPAPSLLFVIESATKLTFRVRLPENAGYRERGRIVVTHDVPREIDYRHYAGLSTPQAKVARDRGAKAVAAAIHKLVPGAAGLVRKAIENKLAEATRHADITTKTDRLAKALGLAGGRIEGGEGKIHDYRRRDASGAGAVIDAQVYSDTVNLNIRSLSHDLAEKVLKLIASNTKKES